MWECEKRRVIGTDLVTDLVTENSFHFPLHFDASFSGNKGRQSTLLQNMASRKHE